MRKRLDVQLVTRLNKLVRAFGDYIAGEYNAVNQLQSEVHKHNCQIENQQDELRQLRKFVHRHIAEYHRKRHKRSRTPQPKDTREQEADDAARAERGIQEIALP